MAIIEAEHGSDNNSKVRRKGNNTRNLKIDKRKASKSSGGAPEVMAKVTGFSKGSAHAKSNIDYISRNGDVDLENDRGEVLKGRDEIKSFAKTWVQEFGDGKRHKNQRDTMHLMLSMPEGTDPEAVRSATRAFARKIFGSNNEYVFALHTDTKNPHTHLTVKCLGANGRRLNPRKADLQRYREVFAKAMEDEGYMANATPRNSRGVVKKAERQVIRHIKERGVSKVEALKVREAADELAALAAGLPAKPKPWLEKIEATQARVRQAWELAASYLAAKNDEKVKNDRANRRVDYGRVDPRAIRAACKLAARLLQPGDHDVAGRRAALAAAGVRRLPIGALVQDEAKAGVLLHSNAQNRLDGRTRRASDPGMRREGASTGVVETRTRGGGEGLNRRQATKLDDKALAEQIRAFVSHMPPVETARDQLTQQLQARFAKGAQVDRPQAVKLPQPEVAKKAEHESNKPTKKPTAER